MSYLVGEFFLQLLLPYIGSLYTFWTWRTGWAAFLTRLADGLYDLTFNACSRVTSTSPDETWHADSLVRRVFVNTTHRVALPFPVGRYIHSCSVLAVSLILVLFHNVTCEKFVLMSDLILMPREVVS